MDRVFILGGQAEGDYPHTINGHREPPPATFSSGTEYRLRFINITRGTTLAVMLGEDAAPQRWGGVAKDGAELPPALQVGVTAHFRLDAEEKVRLCMDTAPAGRRGACNSLLFLHDLPVSPRCGRCSVYILEEGLMEQTHALVVIGHVESPLTDPALAPKQGDEGGPHAWLVFRPSLREALRDLTEGEDVLVLTWLDRADRQVLRVHPRDDTSRPPRGVFSTRSADRPNPIGLHRVRILSIQDGVRFLVTDLEAIHMTPILDLKPVLGTSDR